MSAPAPPQLPDMNSGPRSFITTDQDRGGIALVICILMAIYTVLCFMVRVHMRATVSGPFGKDDVLCTIATVFGVIQMIVSTTAIHHGFGKALVLLTPSEVENASKAVYAAQLLYIITNALTKCTVVLLLARIVFIRSKVYSCYAVLGLSCIWGFASFLASAIRCTTYNPWGLYGDRCPNLLLVWQLITAFNIIIEVCIFAMPCWLVWELQTDFWKKLTVVWIFSLRLPVIAFAALRLHYLSESLGSTEPLFDGLIPFVFLNLEMHYGLMAATMPTLKPFVGAFNTQWGTFDTQGLSGYGQNSGGSYALQSIERRSGNRSGKKGNPLNRTQNSASDRDNGDFASYGKNFAHVTSTKSGNRHSAGSGESQQGIIRQTVTCEVHVETNDSRSRASNRDEDSIEYARRPPISPTVMTR